MATSHPLQHRYIVASKIYLEAIQFLNATRKDELRALDGALDGVSRASTRSELYKPIVAVKAQLELYLSQFGVDTWDIDAFLQDQRQQLFSVWDGDDILAAPAPRQYIDATDRYFALAKDTHVALQNDMSIVCVHHAAMVDAYGSLSHPMQQAMYEPLQLIKDIDIHSDAYVKGMLTMINSYVN
jgi:hypothetical protein